MNKIISNLLGKKNKQLIKIDFVKDWEDEGLFLKKMSGKDMFAYSSIDKEELNTLETYVGCIARCVVDSLGEQVFVEDEELDYLREMPFVDLTVLFKKATGTATSEEIEDVKKK